MKLFRSIRPEDAEVLRRADWVCYDAISLVRGDIIRIREGDIVPADATVLSLGLNHIGGNVTSSVTAGDLVVDHANVMGETRPRVVTAVTEDGSVGDGVEVFYGGKVLQGSAIAVVTSVGEGTLLARLMREGRWPPGLPEEEGDLHPKDVGFALLPRNS